MSVAFRRDGDEEHLEPKFELPIPPGPNLVTARGLAQIRAKVVELEALLPTHTEEAAITIVGDDEARPASGLLAFSAPLCRAMMDAEVGEKLDFAGKSEAIEILAITAGSD